MHQKVFVYAVRRCAGGPGLLAFESLDEPGYEVPKGSVEPGETLEEAARRELSEEAGLCLISGFEPIGTTLWQNEEQTFFRVLVSDNTRDMFEHTVTGRGGDTGFTYRFRWLPIGERLRNQLVQGSGAFVAQLLDSEPRP